MLSADENRLLTEVGPTTRMGALLRRYWHPIAAVRELDERPMRPIRILGEDLVLYRSKSGSYGLIDRRCPHRGSDLAYGIVESDGLRCSYHGWCFDARGRCVEQPFEQVARPEGNFREKIQLKAYQVGVRAGLIWAYLGPAPAPCLVDWERFHGPGQPSVSFTRVPCNWLQCQENSIDPVHFEWLHQNLNNDRSGSDARAPRHLEISFEETDFGFVYRRVLEGTDRSDALWTAGRSTVWPNGLFAGGFVWHVPVDDENTMFVTWDLIPTRRPIDTALCKRGELEREPGGLYKMHDFVHQDSVGMLGQGAIADRSREALGESDRGVILLRRRLLADLAALESAPEGWDPKAVRRDEARNQRVPLPFSPHAMPGFTPGGIRARVRAKAVALLERANWLGRGARLPTDGAASSLAMAREVLQGLGARVAKVAEVAGRTDALARVRRLAARVQPKGGDAIDLTNLIQGYQLSALLYVFAKLGVADALAGGPKSAAELARATAAHAPSLERILRALVHHGVVALERDAFRLTPLSERLRSDVEGSARGLALLAGEQFMPAWGALLHNVRSGETAFRHVFGMSNWAHRAANPELSRAYQDISQRGATWAAERLLAGHDLTQAEHIVDVGGGRGAFLGLLLARHPRARGTVLDEAHVVAESAPLLGALGVADRCAIVAGDFFVAVPAGADVYLLKNVLHNWEDPEAKAILETCRRAMTRSGAKLLVLETVLPADGAPLKTADMHMMVIDGGRERSEAEYRALFTASGLRLVRTVAIAAALSALEVTTASITPAP